MVNISSQIEASSNLDTEAQAALPDEMRREIIARQQRICIQSNEPLADPSNAEEMDNTIFLTFLASVLNKRHNAICYHRVREAQAAGTIRVGWIPGEHNLADLFTKTTMAGNTRHGLVVNIFNDEATRLEPEVE